MRFFGHPIHPMIIHFPTALLPADVVLSFLHYYKHDSAFGQAGFYCLIGGVTLGVLALLSGLLDLLFIPKGEKQALASALIHGFVNGTVILVFCIFAYKEWNLYPAVSTPAIGTLVTKAILVLIVIFGNYLGGRLIYKYHIGIENQPDGKVI